MKKNFFLKRMQNLGQIDLDFLLFLFANFIVIGLLIAVSVTILFSAQMDLRQDTANVIADKLVNAIDINGYLNENILSKDFSVLDATGLDSKQFTNGGQFYFGVGILENGNILKTYESGNKIFATECSLNGKNCRIKSEKNLMVRFLWGKQLS